MSSVKSGPSPLITGYVLAGVGSFLFATKGIFIKLVYEHGLDASTLMMLRLALATPVFVIGGMLTWLKFRNSLNHPPIVFLKALGVGVLGYWLASYTDFMGLKFLTPQFERLILFTYPLFVILMGAAFFKQPFKARSLAFFALSYLGLAVVFVTDLKMRGDGVVEGAAWVMASSVSFALYLLLARGLIKQLGPSMFTSWAMTGAALATFLHYGVMHGLTPVSLSLEGWALVIGLAIGATVLPSYFINFALQRISSQANAVIGFINPVITLILSGLVLREHLTPADMIGTVLVVAGVALYSHFDAKSGGGAKGEASRPTDAR